MGRTIAIGDIHGCLNEFKDLLDLIGINDDDTLVLLGDLVDRGPDSNGVCEYYDNLQLKNKICLVGNHDYRYIRYLRYEDKVSKNLIDKNPMRLNEKYLNLYKTFSTQTKEFLLKQDMKPFFKQEDWIYVHGGIPSNFKSIADTLATIDEDLLNLIIHYRYLNKSTGKFVSLDHAIKKPEETVFWTKKYYGDLNVCYGHNVFETINFDINDRGAYCVGIDTGCVFGGSLTAFEPKTHKIWSVKAQKEYELNRLKLDK